MATACQLSANMMLARLGCMIALKSGLPREMDGFLNNSKVFFLSDDFKMEGFDDPGVFFSDNFSESQDDRNTSKVGKLVL